MKQQLDQVQRFLDKFEVPTNTKPSYIEHELFIRRCNHIMEELKELAYTYGFIRDNNHNPREWVKVLDSKAELAEVLDALVDIQYLVLGTALMHGFGDIFTEAFTRVHIANMDKVLTGDANHKLGIAKPDGWVKPNLKELIDGI